MCLWRGEDELFADCLVGRLVDLEGDVNLCVVEFLLVVILLPVCRGCPPQVLLPHVGLDVVAQFLPHLAAWPGALVDRLDVLSLQIICVIVQAKTNSANNTTFKGIAFCYLLYCTVRDKLDAEM